MRRGVGPLFKEWAQHPFFGRRHQPDALSKISVANKGRKPKSARKVIANGVVYESQEAAAKALGVLCGTITHWLSGHVKCSYTATSMRIAG